MNVVVMIQGREAIPVRAIPLLTDWEVLSPDELAGSLAGDYPHNPSFEKLTAHRSEGSRLKDVKPRWWSNFSVGQLEALSHRIKHKEISHDDGYEQWQRESLPLLPPGVFVWKDEFEACFWSAYGPDGEIEWVAVEGGFKMRKRKEFIELDFEPLVSAELSDLVMKGFEPQTTYSTTPESQTEPVVADSASGGVEPDKAGPVNKRWVMKRAAFIKKHTTQWPTINRDFQDSSENGLSKAAKAPGHGEWFEAAALNWAEQRGKLEKEKEQSPINVTTVWTGRKHTIKG